MNYAVITDGVVSNVIWLSPENAGDFPGAVYLCDRPAGIGDTYEDGRFYRDNVEVLTPAEQLAAALAALTEIEEALNNG